MKKHPQNEEIHEIDDDIEEIGEEEGVPQEVGLSGEDEDLDFGEEDMLGNPFESMLLTSEGESVPDVLKGIQSAFEKQNKILFKISNQLADLCK